MLRNVIVMVLAGGALAATSIASHAADPGFCARYAQTAVRQFNANVATPGCFAGADLRWNIDYGTHYGWCLRAS